jgi:hypothetical protein
MFEEANLLEELLGERMADVLRKQADRLMALASKLEVTDLTLEDCEHFEAEAHEIDVAIRNMETAIEA